VLKEPVISHLFYFVWCADGFSTMPCMFACVSELVQGRQLLCLWSGNFVGPSGTNISNTESPDSVLLQVWLSVCLSVSMSACLLVCLSISVPVCLSLCLSVCLSVCLLVSISVPVCLSLWLSVSLSVSQSVCLLVSISVPSCLSLSVSQPVCLLHLAAYQLQSVAIIVLFSK